MSEPMDGPSHDASHGCSKASPSSALRLCGITIASRAALVRLFVLMGAIAIALVVAHRMWIVMPGNSFTGALPEATPAERALAEALARDVQFLAGEIGPRNRAFARAYTRAADHIERRLRSMGYEPRREPSPDHDPTASPGNIIVERHGGARSEEILVIGAHYDSFEDSPGANDNATGVAAVLALAEAFSPARRPAAPERTLRFVLFADEEPPYFQTEDMGSLTHARASRRAGDRIVGMLSLETMGWYSDEPESQKYPPPLGSLYPDRGNFIGFVANPRSRAFLHEVIGAFRETTEFPSEGAALPGVIPGISWSDHWSFWQEGYPGLMITDTAPFRYPYYHTTGDTPDKINALKLARVVAGLERVLGRLAGADRPGPSAPHAENASLTAP
ncbi:MAG: M28 family peptidase [Phycisphaeraceae bacterium]|nr:M28 family peptidase [Phycisphaeraceae bacterium]